MKNLCVQHILTTIGLFFIVFALPAQNESDSYTVRLITEPIVLDGILDEAIWQEAEVIKDFWQYFPSDTSYAKHATEVKLAYSKSTMYVAVKAFSPNSEYVVSSLRRDFSGPRNDNVTVLFDTFQDGTNAFGFGVTPYGVQREVLVANGGNERSDFNATWDVKWQTESYIGDGFYSVEMAIPFNSLKFKSGTQQWSFRAYRFNVQTNEWSTSVRIPQNQILANLAFSSTITFEEPLGKSVKQVAIIPYVNTLTQKDFSTNESESSFKVGADAKIAIGDGLNLDLTLNPDFSNVEVDDIFTNLTRFELRLPERRQFFIDNGDLFSSFGNRFNEARPFFSRRIGLARDTSDNLIQNDIVGGLRLSGKLDENWRLGLLNIQTAEDEANEIASANNMMVALQRKVAARSNLGVFMVNKQVFGDVEFLPEDERYNRVVGADYNLASESNVWSGRFYLHKSFQPEDDTGNHSAQASLTYNKNNLELTTDFAFVDEDFRADLGFVPRTDIVKLGGFASKAFNTNREKGLARHTTSVLAINYWSPETDFLATDNFVRPRWRGQFVDGSSLEVGFRHNYIFLRSDFDPSRTEGAVPLPAEVGYYFNQANIEYSSNNTNLFTYEANATVGSFFNGDRYSAGGGLSYRFQPWGQFSVGANYDGIRLPDPYSDADIVLFTQRSEVTFNKSLF